ncbi:MAG: T9SS type A sorting domain-containing protein [Saprospiraceae bacterium]|nr:T9SS type A sorting domain-containing protein [Saprospiraceae bacterium]
MIRQLILMVILIWAVLFTATAQRCGAVYTSELVPEPTEVVWPFRGIIQIPVVVHVVYKSAAENISNAQIESQLAVLNADYRRLADTGFIPAEFRNRIADMQLEFCLAKRDPKGLATSGVTRKMTNLESIGLSTAVYYDDQGGTDAWNPDQYLNIWIANMGANQTGRSSFPGQGIQAEDGVVIDPRYFGTIGLAADEAPYHLGRTATHEIGHYFNLLHPWGPDPISCNQDDGVTDTPESGQTFLMTCPTDEQESCSSSDMYTNFMYYTDDACMGQFTPGQRDRVWATLFGVRAGLLESLACYSPETAPDPNALSFQIVPNPNDGYFEIHLDGFPATTIQLALYSMDGRLVWQDTSSYSNPIGIGLPVQLASGVYILRITANGQRANRKFLKL